MVSLSSHGCPGTHYVDQAGLNLRDWFASGKLGVKACGTIPGSPLQVKMAGFTVWEVACFF